MFASHLNKKIGTSELEQAPSRDGYGAGLKAAGERDRRVVALCCDLTESTRTSDFVAAFPDRFIQVGIAEQNMVSVASGLAAMGKIPFTASYAMFSPGRSWEQIRTTVCYNESNVKIIGAHAGVSVGPDGATHQAIEDMAIMRVIPNMVVIAPADSCEAEKATLAAAAYDGPVYIRVGREKTPIVTTPDSPFTIGKAELFYDRDQRHSKTVGLIVTGTLVHQVLLAAVALNEEGIGASVLHVPTIKPLDTAALESFAAEHERLVTIEEHQIIGGLGSAVCEHLAATTPKSVLRLGINDRFGQSGTPEELIAHYGLDKDSILVAVRATVR